MPRLAGLLGLLKMPNLQTEIAQIATEIVGLHFRLWQDSWDFRNYRPRLLALPILPAENGWLHAEIEKIDQVADRDCRDCRSFAQKCRDCRGYWLDENAEFADGDCQDCDGGCRPTLQTLARLLGFPRMQIIARLPRSPKLSTRIAGVIDIVGRDWVIAFWDWKSYLGCRTRLPGLPPKDAEICGVAESGKFSVRDWRMSWPRLLRLRRRLPANIAWTAEIAGNAEKADVSKIVEIAEAVARDCRDYRFFRLTMGDCMLTLKTIDEIAGRDCRDCRDCRPKTPKLRGLLRVSSFQSEFAKSPDQDCWDCDVDCRPTLHGLQRLLGMPRKQMFPRLSRLPRLSPQIAGVTDISGREWVIACWDWNKWTRLPAGTAGTAQDAAQKCRDWWGCWECRIFSPRCSKPWPRLLRLRWRLPAYIAETAEINVSANNADISKTVEITEIFAPDCRHYR